MTMFRIVMTLRLGALCLAIAATPAAAEIPDGDIVGTVQTYTVQKGDSVFSIARRFDIGAVELLAANPSITSAKPATDEVLTIPTAHILPQGVRTGIVINLAELRLFYFKPDGDVLTFPVSIGRAGWQTPTGTTEVVRKRKNPTWTPPASIRAEDPSLPEVVPAGPNNPLGQHALSLGWPGYAIHGTNAPASIGKPASHGCVRMYPEDIETLFGVVEVGTPVTFIDTPVKYGWRDGALFVEVTPDQAQARAIAAYRTAPPSAVIPDPDGTALWASLHGMGIDMAARDAAIRRHDGIPVELTPPAAGE
jgi:L,D-transpeptidase ErfK/SrfK